MDLETTRCDLTIDLEEIIMSKNPDEFKFVKADITWNSGRVETLRDKLDKNNQIKKQFSDKVAKYRQFPTVKNVQVEKY